MSTWTDDLIQLDLESSRSDALRRERWNGVQTSSFDIERYLERERTKDLLRFSTAGSVDDGKSTLIGRLLYDTQSIYDDQIRSIEGKGSAGAGVLDFALLTDGLRAEREQGITIDVAYRYFSTAKRKFIIADTPGHEQYTRNMATGASTADAAVVLIDARKGVLTQSRRHAYITSLLGVKHVIVAVNKMDLVGYSQDIFGNIREEFLAFYSSVAAVLGRQGVDEVNGGLHFVPISALEGDNVVRRTEAMPWYNGPSLLDLLESIPPAELVATAPFRLAVQRVIRPHDGYRGFAGQIASGTIRPGDPVLVLPSGRTTSVRSIVTFNGELREAQAPLSVSLTLDDEVDISRGDLLVTPQAPATVTTRFTASLVWMDVRPLDLDRRYLLKHTSRIVSSQVRTVRHTLNITNLAEEAGTDLAMNEIGRVEIETSQPIPVDSYRENRRTGSFVLIDLETNATVAAGMVLDIGVGADRSHSQSGRVVEGRVTPEERMAKWGHTGAHLALTGPPAFADQVERALFLNGAFTVRLSSFDPGATEHLAVLQGAGCIAITHKGSSEELGIAEVGERRVATSLNDTESFLAATDAVLKLLRHAGVITADRRETS